MSNAPDQIGQYSIERELGRGGMGVVYLAHDSRLGRDVAIKALPDEVSQDAERLARFEREARALAQLDHPNLAGIHGIEEHDGRRYLVLEYVEGETLSEILERGPLPLDEALDWCSQVAAGVASAHDCGVVHRDLKPDNIKITREGKAKVLDFGLAKASDPQSSSNFSGSMSPTLTTPLAGLGSETIPGAIMGTAPYMSPEQARGRHVDRRTDVWSFGCILYECLTGARLFAGESATDSMGAILHKEISFDRLPDTTPPRVRELLARMLERNRDQRQRDLGDAMLELEAARRDPGETIGAARGSKGRRLGWALVLALMLLAGAVWVNRGAESGAALPAYTVMQLTDGAENESWPTLTPDGQTLVYAAWRPGGVAHIFRRRVSGFNATDLTPNATGDCYMPALSPDGQRIAFRSERDGGGLFVMGATGESPRRLTDLGYDASWSPDQTKLVFATEGITNPATRMSISELWTVDVQSGQTKRIHEGDAVQPRWSPSGARIAFWRVQHSGQRDIYTIRADGTDPVALMNDAPTDWNPIWSPDGKWIYFSSDRGGRMSIWRIGIDEETGLPTTEPAQITTGTRARIGSLAISGDGKRLAFTSTDVEFELLRLDLDPETNLSTGPPTLLTPFASNAIQPSISPDGRFIAYSNVGEPQEDLFIISSDGSTRRRVTNDAPKDRGVEWAPDNERLMFYSDRDGKYRYWSVRLDGGDLMLVAEADSAINTPEISPDGEYIAGNSNTLAWFIFRRNDQGEYIRMDDVPQPPGAIQSSPLDWAPIGTKALIVSPRDEVGSHVIWVLDVESGAYEIVEEDYSGLLYAQFFNSDRLLIILTPSNIIVRDLDTGERHVIYEFPPSEFRATNFDLAPDGSWICLNANRTESDLWMLEFEE